MLRPILRHGGISLQPKGPCAANTDFPARMLTRAEAQGQADCFPLD
jgi:hypothetical protein